MCELERAEFLLDRDGRQTTIEWYERTIGIYELAADRAVRPQEQLGSLQVARGKEWANKYKNAATACKGVLNWLKGYNSDFSNFIRNATDEEKEKVYKGVIDKSIEMQEDLKKND